MQIPKALKSKTITMSAAYFALFEILGAFEVEVPQRAILAGFVLLSWILRVVTKVPLGEK